MSDRTCALCRRCGHPSLLSESPTCVLQRVILLHCYGAQSVVGDVGIVRLVRRPNSAFQQRGSIGCGNPDSSACIDCDVMNIVVSKSRREFTAL